MNCELCGVEDILFSANIEGTELNVCKRCLQFGKAIDKPVDAKAQPRVAKAPEKEVLEVIVPNCARIVKERREALNLKQEDLAKRLSEKVSIIHKVETGAFVPDIALARKFESFLKIKLIEQIDSGEQHVGVKAPSSLTIGDFVKIRK